MSERLGGETLDPGIRRVVELIQGAGFETTDSGDGQTKLANGWSADEALDYPHVFVETESGEMAPAADGVRALLKRNGVDIQAANDDGAPYIQATYDPVTGVAIIAVVGVSDDMLEPISPAGLTEGK